MAAEWCPRQEEAENEYERQRRQQIARNQARMLELELPSLAAQMKPQPKSAFKPRGVAARKRTLVREPAHVLPLLLAAHVRV